MKKFLALMMSFLLLLSMTACGSSKRNASVRAKTEKMLDAVLADDAETAFTLLSDVLEEEEFRSFFENVKDYLHGVETYELKQTGWHSKFSGGVTTYTVAFKMTTNSQTYWINAVESSEYDGLVGFNIVSEADQKK